VLGRNPAIVLIDHIELHTQPCVLNIQPLAFSPPPVSSTVEAPAQFSGDSRQKVHGAALADKTALVGSPLFKNRSFCF
jgi:hypothetical protein